MFERLVFATDLSPASDMALDCVARWKGLGLRKVTVTHVHSLARTAGLEDVLRRDHEPKLERQAQRLRDAGLFASWRLEFGVPYLELEGIAREEGAEAVVLGSHGSSWVKEVWLGSVADAILRHVQLPVLVIKVNLLAAMVGEECGRFCDSLFTRVLLATDFSSASKGATAFAKRLAEKVGPQFHLVHVQEHSRLIPHLRSRLDEFNREDTLRLEELASELRTAGASEVSLEIRLDHAVSGIVAAVKAWQPGLVLVGRHGRGGRRLIGSVAHDVARESPAPVLVIPEEV
ncbi:MAG: universal stress protein [Thermoanaerobaculum sp.]